jgi:hypothetical protein
VTETGKRRGSKAVDERREKGSFEKELEKEREKGSAGENKRWSLRVERSNHALGTQVG